MGDLVHFLVALVIVLVLIWLVFTLAGVLF